MARRRFAIDFALFATLILAIVLLSLEVFLQRPGVALANGGTHDFGDAPDPTYPSKLVSDGARHLDPTALWLGATSTSEDDSVQSGDAADDGVLLSHPLSLDVWRASTSTSAFLNILADLNDDGDWEDTGEWILANNDVTSFFGANAENTLASFGFGNEELPLNHWIRVTLTSVALADYDGTGEFAMGETEDYFLTEPINPRMDLGDAPDPTYPSRLASNGSRHFWDDVRLGSAWTSEADSVQVNADGDDGLVSFDPLTVTTLNTLPFPQDVYLNVLIDWDDDGDWDDLAPDDWAVQNLLLADLEGATTTNFGITPPADTWVRITVTDQPITDYDGTGKLGAGETEDYNTSDTPPLADELTVNVTDENGDPLQGARVLVYDASDPGQNFPDFGSEQFTNAAGVASYPDLGDFSAGDEVLVSAIHGSGYALSVTTTIPGTANLSATTGANPVNFTVLDSAGNPLDDAEIGLTARPAWPNGAGTTPDGGGSTSIFVTPGDWYHQITERVDDFYFLELGTLTITPTTTDVTISAQASGSGTVTVNTTGTWDSAHIAPFHVDSFSIPGLAPPPGTPVTIVAGSYSRVGLSLTNTVGDVEWTYDFNLFPGLTVSDGDATSTDAGGTLSTSVSGPVAILEGDTITFDVAVLDSFGNAMDQSSTWDNSSFSFDNNVPHLTVQRVGGPVVYSQDTSDLFPSTIVVDPGAQPGGYVATYTFETHAETLTSSMTFYVVSNSATDSTVSGTVSLEGVGSTSTLAAIDPMIHLQSLDSSASATVSVSPDGTFSIPGLPIGERFTGTAAAPGFITSVIDQFVTAASTTLLGQHQLSAGDVNEDGAVTILDVSAAAASFGQAVVGRVDGSGRYVDMNGDGTVNVMDITAIANNFGLAGPQTWPLP